MLALLDMADAMQSGAMLDPAKSNPKVLGIDINIRPHNREAIEAHPMASRIQMIQGSSIAAEIVAQVREIAADYQRVLVCLDSNHTCPRAGRVAGIRAADLDGQLLRGLRHHR